jgi:hypothetical protein
MGVGVKRGREAKDLCHRENDTEFRRQSLRNWSKKPRSGRLVKQP